VGVLDRQRRKAYEQGGKQPGTRAEQAAASRNAGTTVPISKNAASARPTITKPSYVAYSPTNGSRPVSSPRP
jgi:hypothetical protein